MNGKCEIPGKLVMCVNKYTPFKGPSSNTEGRLKVRREEIYTAPFTDPVKERSS